MFWFLLKVYALVFFFIWARATMPRIRVDQIMFFSWKFLLPASVIVLIFTGLTAFDTQRIKSEFYEGAAADIQTKQAVFGAVSLYVNFLNIFMALLSLFGQRNN